LRPGETKVLINDMRVLIVSVLLAGFAPGCLAEHTPSAANDYNADGSVETVLKELRQKTSELQSHQCKLEYLFSQPLLDSKTLRTGMLYYSKHGDKSRLRISFETLKQDDEPAQEYIEHYIFDGEWLTHIDYQIKHVQKRQLAEPNEPVDAFELAQKNFPIIGFSKADDLQKQFEVNIIGEPNELIHLHLKVRPESQYAQDYESVDIWLDREIDLPVKLEAVSTESDIYEIKFIEPKVNQKIDTKVFDIKAPAEFGKPEIILIEK